MNIVNKYQTLIIGLAVILGLLIGQMSEARNYAEYFIVPFLMIMLFGLFLNIPIKNLLKSFSNLKFFSANIGINFIWTPVFAYGLGYLLLRNELSIWIGFVMLMVTPCTDWYLIFTGTAKGNTPLSASVLPLNLILQVILLPVYLLLFFGRTGTVDSSILFESIILVLLVPFVLAQTTRYVSKQSSKVNLIERISPFFDKSQVIFLGLALMAMFASQGDSLINNLEIVVILLIPLFLFFVVNFFIGRLVSSLLKFNYEDSASLNLTTLARNSPISLAIAITAFPNEPLVALALVIGPLIELPILTLVSQILLKIRKVKVVGE
tara:strand:- start:1658 stop:2623 length:966 start_codon:yes stop_codon:yes gene_type:complete